MRHTGWFVFVALLAGLSYAAGVYTGPRVTNYLTPEGESGLAPTALESCSALGRLQPTLGIISVVATPGDRITKLDASQGDTVTAGKLLVQLASLDDRQQELKLAEDQLADARKQRAAIKVARAARIAEFAAQLQVLEETARDETAVQAAKLKVLESQSTLSKRQLDALMQLNPSIVDVPREQMDKARAAFEQADLELGSARTVLKTLANKYVGQIKALDAQKAAVMADFDFRYDSVPEKSLEQKVELARLQLKRSLLTSPVEGMVLKVFNRTGDATGPEPVLQIASGKEMTAVAEVYATDVEKLTRWMKQKGVLATISSPALGSEKLTGKVLSPNDIAPSVNRNTVMGFNPRADTDRRVVEVRVRLDDPARASHLVGLDVTVEFKPAP